ncbi:DUF2267 domain-containing protein [Allostreptomyces psammosilenae]|uniref:Uncharacterized protein (DUF2267 family) n=1 Tax=Allostreptomyces psammosilenae TaxID=1892865 RepID=A0A852ZQ66_9ACTN|nr:DUF2267 domain-containing protein [Allostreptomyces psammosilenae]NYI03637.1 uncharacterized protein (DUF2267 family) [Allostreptomyces psammosilenae]
MDAGEFVARVRERGEYPDREEAERVCAAVLSVLGHRLGLGEPEDLAAQLPSPLAEAVLSDAGTSGHTWGVEEFLRHVAEATGGTVDTARLDASAVLSTLAEAVHGGELNQLISQLPPAYTRLFGLPGLA